MAVTLVGSTDSATGTVNKPAGTENLDLVILNIIKASNGAASLSGWTALGNRNISSVANHTVLAKIASGEGSSWTVSGASAIVCNTFRNAILPTNLTSNGTSGASVSVTTLKSNSWLLDCVGSGGSGTITHDTPSGYTSRGSQTDNIGAVNLRVTSFIKEIGSPIGSYAVTNDNANLTNSCFHIEIPMTFETDKFFAFMD